MTPEQKQRAIIAHYQAMAAEAARYRAEQERMNTLFAQLQADALIDRIRRHNTSGCFAEPTWLERTESAFRREFGAWAVAGALLLGFLFGASAMLTAILCGLWP